MLQRVYDGVRPSNAPPTSFLPTVHLAPPASVFAGVSVPSATTVDLRTLLPLYVDDQIGSQCVGEALAAANFAAVGCQGQRASHRGVYVGARVLERASSSSPIPDKGCRTTDAYSSLIQVGYYPLDANDTDPSQLNAMDTWGEESKLKRLPTSCLVALSDGDVTGLQSYLLQTSSVDSKYVCATFTINVDTTYEALSSKSPVWGGPTGTLKGYHRQAIAGLALVAGVLCVIAWNSWSTSFADGGFAYIPVPIFQKVATEVVVHLAGVVL